MKSVEEEEEEEEQKTCKRDDKRRRRRKDLLGASSLIHIKLVATATTKDQQSDDDVHASRRSCRGQPIFLHLPFTTSHQRRVANQGRFFTRLLAKKTNVRNSR